MTPCLRVSFRRLEAGANFPCQKVPGEQQASESDLNELERVSQSIKRSLKKRTKDLLKLLKLQDIGNRMISIIDIFLMMLPNGPYRNMIFTIDREYNTSDIRMSIVIGTDVRR